MTNPITPTELTGLVAEIRQGFQTVNESLSQLAKEQAEIDKRIVAVENKLEGIDKRLSNVESSVQKIPDLSEKIGELKNWKQAGIIVITALISSVFTGTIGGFIGWALRGIKS